METISTNLAMTTRRIRQIKNLSLFIDTARKTTNREENQSGTFYLHNNWLVEPLNLFIIYPGHTSKISV